LSTIFDPAIALPDRSTISPAIVPVTDCPTESSLNIAIDNNPPDNFRQFSLIPDMGSPPTRDSLVFRRQPPLTGAAAV
jgi:hypothetical protein